ncbi:MAG: family 20 glycosylhydrolase [Dysgonomonas sp.]|nr:family 20 glycosylhydrolase [Dysgonomonas sp.]
MFRKSYLILTLLILLIACTNNNPTSIADYNIVPLPKDIKEYTGTNFTLKNSTKIAYPKEQENLKKHAQFLSDYIKQITGYELSITNDIDANNIILLNANYVNKNKEAYLLAVSNNNITINGASEAGIFYGIQTLRKTIPASASGDIKFAQVEITDYPAYKHRGASLDVSRHFFSADFVKKYIDILALCNMNVLHWHLTDDQGWRIEIKRYPKLTEIGSQREKTIIGRHTNTFNNVPHGGFYTQEEIKEIVQYAADRHVAIIPEIDIPGHTLAVLASYPELGCTGGPYKVGCEWGIYEDVLCAGNEDVFTFLENVFDEVNSLFPSRYIHIGGDECLKNRWKACPKCQKRIKDLGLKGKEGHTIEEELQSYFITRVEKMVNAKGKSIIGWDEILEGGIAPNATIMSWRGTEGGIFAANSGHDVIMTPEQYVYLDYYQSPDVDKEPFTYGWLTDLKKTYSFDPMPKDLEADKKKHILGAQVNIWAEYMPESENVEYMLLPRMCALAETVWTNPENKDYNNFVTRLYKLSKHFDKLGYKNCKEAYNVQDSIEINTEKGELKVHLSTFDKRPIFATIDGKERVPQLPILIKEPKSIVIESENGKYEKNFIFNLATAKPITLKYQPDKRYTFKGAETLVDGQLGAISSYRTGTWLGFLGTDFEATIDLKKLTGIRKVEINIFVNTRGNLFPPKSYTVYISPDNVNFKQFYRNDFKDVEQHISPEIVTRATNIDGAKARYVKIVMENIKTLPSWHEKKGDKAYLMIDEIIVE